MNDSNSETNLGRAGFASRVGLDNKDREDQLTVVLDKIKSNDLQVIRVGFVDAHGTVRIRPVEASHFAQASRNGVPFTTALLAMDSGNFIFKPVFSGDGGFGRREMGGAGDVLGVPDLSTFCVLPWADRTGWVLADLYLSSGEPCPYDPRSLLKSACAALSKRGMSYVGGIEVECHVFKIKDARLGLEFCDQPATPPAVDPLSHAYQHMSELVYDAQNPIVEPLRNLLKKMDLPLRTIESELGPGQIEVTLDPLADVAAADAMSLLRTTIKQFARRIGCVATFMAKPGLPNVFSSGWHLHQSLRDQKNGQNLFASEEAVLSKIGLQFVGGILENVGATTAFSNPTINGYKRLNANPLTPKRAVWSHDNRAAMCRVIGGPGERSTHVENRSGEPSANPYLYMASQIYAGLDGIDRAVDPGPPLDDPYAQTDKIPMPASLQEAVHELEKSEVLRKAMGSEFVDYYVAMKRHEIGRFMSAVTDWEHREYFENF
ncbi:glutamine synthetase family protein [Bradyrhizobium quebecense]|uniref:Glutamine synthetase family protein n=2 Tax=Bradyrhizobium quebecense TaxID=2748629 RepID=A0ACD3V7T9_9BRAD|nr:glutamine synthetase family protein [Bradyrhizobium quebecense]UGY02511.1 glutamine synthetase family protein [Bradyrhizobium quebecense]